MNSTVLCENQAQSRIQAKSPLMFESDDEAIDEDCAANISNKVKIKTNTYCNDEPTKEEQILKGLQTVLLGIPPPPAFTVPQLDSREILKLWRENQKFRVTLSPKKCTKDLVKALEEKANTTEWPEVLRVDHWDVYYNRGIMSEEIERLSVRYKERYVGAETSSCINALFIKSPIRTASARKRARHRAWGHSPGRRLSHLARRRKAFSSANLCSVAGNRNPDKKMIMVEIKKISSRQKKKGSAKKTKPTPNKKKQLQANTYKRALFQSPDQLPMAKESQTPSSQCIQRSKRNLFAESSGEKKMNENGKRERPIMKRASPRKRVNRSLSFQDTGQTADLKINPPPVTTQLSQTSLTGAHKQKMLWAVTNALREENMGMNHDLFRPCMSVLFKTCQKLWLTKVLKNGQDGSTSERMLALAKQFSSYTIKEISADPTSEHMVLVCNNIMRMAESTLNQLRTETDSINQVPFNSGQPIRMSKEVLPDAVKTDSLNPMSIQCTSKEKPEMFYHTQAIKKKDGALGLLKSEINVLKYKSKTVDSQLSIFKDESSKIVPYNMPVMPGTSKINLPYEKNPVNIQLQSNKSQNVSHPVTKNISSEFSGELSEQNLIDKEKSGINNSQCRSLPNASCDTLKQSCNLEKDSSNLTINLLHEQSCTKMSANLRDPQKISQSINRTLSGFEDFSTSKAIVQNKQSSPIVDVQLIDSLSKSSHFNTLTSSDLKDMNSIVSPETSMSCTHNNRIKPTELSSPFTPARTNSGCSNTCDSLNHTQSLKPTLGRSLRLISPKSTSKNNSPVKSVCLKYGDRYTICGSEVKRISRTDYETDKENVESQNAIKHVEIVESCSIQRHSSSVESKQLNQLVSTDLTNKTLQLYRLSNSEDENADTDRLLPLVFYLEPPKLVPHWEQDESKGTLKSEDTLESEETLKSPDSPPSLVPHWEQSSCSGTSTSLPESIMTHWQQLMYNANTSDKIMFDFEDTSYEITFPNLGDDSRASSTCAPFTFAHYVDDSKSGFNVDLRRSSTD